MRSKDAHRPALARHAGAMLLCAALWSAGACTRDGDDGYTALLRYAITDFRVAGISARLVDTSGPLPLPLPGVEVELRAVVLQGGGEETPELEWLDCPSFIYEGQSLELEGAVSNVDCLGTAREIRLGRGQTIRYRMRDFGSGGLPWFEDGGPPSRDATQPQPPDPNSPGPIEREEPVQLEIDDGLVFLRASRGEVVRYGRKSFLGLFVPDRARPFIDGLTVDGAPRDNEQRDALVRAPGARVRVRFEVVGITEDRMVQWFVTGGDLQRHGLTYYTEVDSRVVGSERVPTATAQNTWLLPDAAGTYEVVAVIGGDFAELPIVRVRVEVRP